MNKLTEKSCHTIKLAVPILLNGIVCSELKMRRPTVGDLLSAEIDAGSDAEQELKFISSLCECAPSDLKHLDLYDYKEVRKILKKMQGSAPQK